MAGKSFDPARPPLTVNPRKPHTKQLPLIVVSSDGALVESSGEINPSSLIENLRQYDPAVIICEHPDRFLSLAHKAHSKDPEWNWRVIPTERQVGYGDLAQIRQELLIAYCGWRHGRDTHYFYPISPAQYGRHSLAELGGEDDPKYLTLYRWGKQLRDWCSHHNMRVTSTSGGIAAQLLRDKRWHPRPRRKVPMATNEKARPHLPGNHYELAAKEGIMYGAAYVLDQAAAHHHAAAEIELPHADGLYARGNWRDDESLERWLLPDQLGALTGLVKAWAFVPPQVAHRSWTPRNLSQPGHRAIWLYTNELEATQKMGVDVQHLIAGWVSETVDTGISEYARWAVGEGKQRPKWLKGTLLSAYGILGARPRHLASCYYRSKRGEPATIWLEADTVKTNLVQTKRERQTPIAHVIQRGMIEAETRRRSLDLARELAEREITVHAVQADAVIVDGNAGQLPLLPHPWRIKERLGWVRFENVQTHYGEPAVSVRSHYPKEAQRYGHVR